MNWFIPSAKRFVDFSEISSQLTGLIRAYNLRFLSVA